VWIFEIAQKIKWDLGGRCTECGAKYWIDERHDSTNHVMYRTCGRCGVEFVWDTLPEFR
jgi:DNA-directed RNA polymerase subunit RPC12/RpoP